MFALYCVCIVLCCIMLCCVVLCCAVLCCVVLCCVVLCCVILASQVSEVFFISNGELASPFPSLCPLAEVRVTTPCMGSMWDHTVPYSAEVASLPVRVSVSDTVPCTAEVASLSEHSHLHYLDLIVIIRWFSG